MKHLTIAIISGLLLVQSQIANAQPWMESVKSENPNFYEIQSSFDEYWKDKKVVNGKYIENEQEKKAFGWKQFKRWEWYWEQRVSKSGEFPSPSVTWDEWNEYRKTHPKPISSKRSASGNWSFMGPSTTPGGYNGLGRVNCIAFHPTNVNTFWVGTPAGGLWKTTDGGNTWTTNTDDLPVLGVSDIAIHPTNPNTMYIATGDGDMGSLSSLTGSPAGDTKSIGILKSTDGGNTWNTTGMNWNVTSAKLIRRLVMNPVYPDELIAATSDGLWRTLNGGNTWSQVQTGYFMDVEFKPNNSDTLYASTFSYGNAQIYRSTDYGTTWQVVTTIASAMRINLAVTPAWPNLVDAVCVNTSSGLAGLWYSSNSGASFTQYFNANCTNNLLHNSYNASGCGGQGHYDLAYAINPTNSSEIWLGGVNTWKSTNGGSSWNLQTMWSSNSSQNPNGEPVVHADKHFFAFHPLNSNIFFECNDGGLYKTTDGGNTWNDLSNGLEISQIYRIGASQTIANNIICGLQDNGSREIYNNQWYEQTGGDGMECIIDYNNANTEYASYANGKIYRTFNFWSNTTTISDNISGQPTGAWVTPFVLHPTNPNTLYAGYKYVYKSTDQGDAWTTISPFLSGNYIRSLAVAPSDPQTIYAASFDTLYVTYDGGSNWYYNAMSFTSGKISYIAVDPNDDQTLWLTISGYISGQKVYKSTDGGTNWTNISGTLPNLPVNCIIYENGSNDGIYIGTDVGVFYRNATMSDWITFNDGLPNVVVTELEISYNNNALWAATFGRGLWQSDLYTPPAPVAVFSANNTTICSSNCINFTDNSTNSPTSWNWSFPGGTPSSSPQQNPTNICYNTAGTYNVSLTVSNAGGSDTETLNGYITVNTVPSAASVSGNPSPNLGASETYTATATSATSYTWSLPAGWTGSSTSSTINVTVGSTSGNICATPNNNCGSGTQDCQSISVVTGIKDIESATAFTIYPNPTDGVFRIETTGNNSYSVKVLNPLGEIILDQEKYSSQKLTIDLSNQPNGIYFIQISSEKQMFSKRIIINK